MELATESEMRNRIRAHKAFRNDSDTVNLLWQGYMIALHEWELLSDVAYEGAASELRDAGVGVLESPMLTLHDEVLAGRRLPTGDELLAAIRQSLVRHSNSPKIHLVWRGYLAALQEWAHFLTADGYHALDDHLSQFGEKERREIFLGVPEDEASA